MEIGFMGPEGGRLHDIWASGQSAEGWQGVE